MKPILRVTCQWATFPASIIRMAQAYQKDPHKISLSDDSIYVTDSARGEVVVISPELEQSVLTGEPQFAGANGIHVNNDDLWVGGGRLWHVDLRDNTVTTVGPLWVGGIDGIEQEADGTLQVTPVGGALIRVAETYEVHKGDGVSSANHGWSENLRLALIPTGFDNTVIAIRGP